MSGKYRGVQARVKELYPLAMHIHCCNHVLNLAICTSSQLPVIRNAIAIISDIFVFLSRFAQRVSQLESGRVFRVGFGFGSGSGRVWANNFHIFRAEFGFIFCSSRNVLRISLEEIGKSSVKCISRYPA